MKKIKILDLVLTGFVIASLAGCNKKEESTLPSNIPSETNTLIPSDTTSSKPSATDTITLSQTPSESSSESSSETPVDPKVYVHEDWTPIGDEKGYFYEEDKIYSNVIVENVADKEHFDYDEPVFNLYKDAVGANYSVAVHYEGSYEGSVDTEMYAGIVAWYKDAQNYVVVGTQWADWDRAHEVREVFATGMIEGTKVGWMDFWSDNCGITPADGITLTVSKIGKNFSFEAKSGNIPVKSGSFLVNGTESDTASVGIFGANDLFTYDQFKTEVITPETKSSYIYQQDENHSYSLELDRADGTFILKETKDGVALDDINGTYTIDGRNVTLYCDDTTTLYAKVYDVTNTFEFYTPSITDDQDTIVVDGTSAKDEYVLKDSFQGDFVLAFDFAGTYTEAGHAIKVGIHPWYVDENNYIDMYIEWSASDRSHEIREVQITGMVNGVDISWCDIWCDGSNKLVSDGFHMTITKTDKTFAFVLTSGTFAKEGSRTIDTLDTSLTYATKLYAQGDRISYSNIEFYQDQSSLYDVSGEGNALLRDTGLVLENTTALLKETFNGDYSVSFDFTGTYTEAGHAIKVGIHPWYVDENNYIDMYIEWSASDRSHEIREVQITGMVNGVDISWCDIWCDGSNKLVSDGFHMTITKTDKTFAFVLTSGTFTKEGSRTVDSLDTALSYRLGYYAEGDTITMTNISIMKN